jgi:hypothetical protein
MNKMIPLKELSITFAIVLLFISCKHSENTGTEEWTTLFNGKDLSGWDIKVAGQPLNDNYKNTFIAGKMLRIVYDQYEKFDGKFAHLYTQTPYSYYKLKLNIALPGNICLMPQYGRMEIVVS